MNTLMNIFMGNVGKHSLHRICLSEKHTHIQKAFHNSRTKPSTFDCWANKSSIDVCVVHSNTSDQWHLAWCPMAERWPSQGLAPWGGGEGSQWNKAKQGKGLSGLSLFIHLHIYGHTHAIRYHLSCAQREQLWQAGDGQCAILPPQAGAAASTGTTWFPSLCTHTRLTHTCTQYITVMEKKATETSGLLIRRAK